MKNKEFFLKGKKIAIHDSPTFHPQQEKHSGKKKD